MKSAIAFTLLMILFSLLSTVNCLAQSPGIVVRPATSPYSSLLDPDQNGFTSITNAGFTTSDVGAAYSEIPYKVVPPAVTEPTGDLATGPAGGFTDIVKTVDGSGFYVYNDGTNIYFRLRIGGITSGSKGYSVLLDTDGKMGNSGPYADPNYLAPTNTSNGNPGFEYEVVLRTGFNVSVYNVDGSSNPTLVTTYPLSSNSLISVALSTDGNNPDYFYDFTVPLSSIGSPTSLRMVATTVTSPSSALQGSRSDIYGIDDAANTNVASAWQTVINAQPTINLTDITSGGTGVAATRTAAPTLNSPIAGGSGVAVTGNWTSMDPSKPSPATISLYKNGILVSTTSVGTGGTWSITVPTVANGDVFYATAQATGESVSLQSSSITAGCSSIPSAPVLTCASSKGISGTIPAGTTILIYQLPTTTASATSIPLTSNITYPTSTTFAYFSNGCTGATNGINGSFMFITSNGGCNSLPIFECVANGSSALTGLAVNSTIAVTTPIYPYQTTISGTGATSGNIIHLLVNGQDMSTITASASTFSFTGLTLKSGDQIRLIIYSGTACFTQSNAYTVSCYTQPAVITTDTTGKLLSTATSISGTSIYSGATVTLYKGTSPSGTIVGSPVTTNSGGGWTVSGLTLTAGDNYYVTISTGGCVSPSSAGAGVQSPTTVCPTITGSYTDASTSVTGTMPSAFTGTVGLFLDGAQIGSASLASATSWTINTPFTYPLYPGGVLSVAARTTGSAWSSGCTSTSTIGCNSPLTPSISPTSSSITTGQTVTFNVGNVSSGSWYALLDNTGASYVTSVYKTTTTSFNLTTNTFNTAGTYNLKLTANNLSGCPLSFQSASIVVAAVLPLSLTSFEATAKGTITHLQWTTATEQNVSHFEIQRGIDGTVFTPIGNVTATGNSRLAENYQFTDPSPQTGKVYYRLRMIDLDGSATYSKVASVYITPAPMVAVVSPNPFTDVININLHLEQPRQIYIRLSDFTGKEMLAVIFNGQKGKNLVQIPQLGRLAGGLYVLNLRTIDGEMQFKLVKGTY
ncbi:MAG: T9SS type A sorting domain-containing protein [Bacteroidetes bacterium]|nr:T9SS type A sorting domain-containing protein [Bacteroidota bacterium]